MAFKFKDKMELPYERILVVDALNLAFRWKHQGKSDFQEDFKRTVDSLAQSYNCGRIIIAADHGSSTYRREIYPDYKADRAERFKDQTPEEKAAFEAFIEGYENTLAYLPYPVLRFKGVEADDIAAYVVKNMDRANAEHIWLVSSDRDWDLLVDERVSRFSYRTRKDTTAENWSEHYDVPREEYISYKVLVGDKGDNIPGVPGIGPKRASTLIEQYGSALDIYDMLPIDSKYKYIQNLNEFGDNILTNYELMDLMTYCDDAIGKENCEEIITTLGDIAW